ncbi:unnamed protein product [Polarella glacialis]|nr:unnamed protein product [Polarella glacialis]CAE8724169.1 unnamed protein product [Polarella glacialis]
MIFDMIQGTYPAVNVELCLPRTLRSAKVIGKGELKLSDVAAGIAKGLGYAKNLVVEMFTEDILPQSKQKHLKEESRGKPEELHQQAHHGMMKRLVGTVTLCLAEMPKNDPVWANLKVRYWLSHGLPPLPTIADVHTVLLALTAAPDRNLLFSIFQMAEVHLLDQVKNYASWNPSQAESELDRVLTIIRQLEATASQPSEIQRASSSSLANLVQKVAGSVLSASLVGAVPNHQLMRPAMKFACALDPNIPELREVEHKFKMLLQFPDKIKLSDLLIASEIDLSLFDPSTFGLELVTNGELPKIEDTVRFGVRAETAQRVLEMIGSTQTLKFSQGVTYERLAMEVISHRDFQLPSQVAALLAKTKLFLGGKVARRSSIQELIAEQNRDWEALLGRFDVVAMPVCADYDDEFKKRAGDKIPMHVFGANPKEPIGGPGWFWALHAAALNIGESVSADDFQE